MKSYEKLEESLIKEFGDRKYDGRLSIVVDTRNGKVYPVPKDREHIAFCTELVGGRDLLPKIVPSHIHYHTVDTLHEVTVILTGESGMEQGYGVRHGSKDLQIAHQRALEFVNDGEIFVHPELGTRSKAIYVYSIEGGR